MRDGVCSEQTTSAPRTAEKESGYWPTPLSSDGVNGGPNQRGGKGDLRLSSAVHHWPTPTKADADRSSATYSRGNQTLLGAVKMWPTPHGFSKDGRSNGPSGNELGRAVNRSTWPTPTVTMSHGAGHQGRSGGLKIQTAVQYATPQSRDYRSPLGHKQRWGNPAKTQNLNDQIGGSLNPTWVEWLMGWPLEWTALRPLATDKFRTRWLSLGLRYVEKLRERI
jgi:hypothetical protein